MTFDEFDLEARPNRMIGSLKDRLKNHPGVAHGDYNLPSWSSSELPSGRSE